MAAIIVFDAPAADWHSFTEEGIPAEQIGADTYRLSASPFFVFGISNQDIVRAAPREDGLRFVEKRSSGGHSTYRMFSNKRTAGEIEASAEFASLRRIGCRWQRSDLHFGPLYAIDVRPDIDIGELFHILETGEHRELWTFEESDFGRIAK